MAGQNLFLLPAELPSLLVMAAFWGLAIFPLMFLYPVTGLKANILAGKGLAVSEAEIA